MPGKKSLQKEIDDLRAQVKAIQNELQSEVPSDLQNQEVRETDMLSEENNLDELQTAAMMHMDPAKIPMQVEEAIKNLTETAEKEIGERPIAAVASAFLLGLLLGRISS